MSIAALIVITLLLSAFFTGIETAYVNANKLKIEVDRNQGILSARILSRLVRRPSRFLGIMLLGNNIALVAYGILMAQWLEAPLKGMLPAGLSSGVMVMVAQIILATLLVLLVAEFLPRILFRIRPNDLLAALAIPTLLLFWLLYPVILLFTSMAEFILRRVFRMKLQSGEYHFSALDLDAFVREFAPDDEKDPERAQEIQMFQNAIEFRTVKLRECMVPRTEIVAVEEGEPVNSLRLKFIESGFSRIMVYRGSIDQIIGYVHTFDLFREPAQLSRILKPVPIFPETMPANKALTELLRSRRSLGVVVDEFGGTSGMVTMEDLMEEIFGEIADEFDVEELTEKRVAEDEFLFSGRLEIDYLNQEYDLGLPESEQYETLAGFILVHSQSIPRSGESIAIGDFLFTVVHASNNRIDLVRLKVMQE
ncbi:MAG TPA: hemolysin family protein [Bacteroidales bacterium]|nr:hemolysin family protein [Bacteroidales bacterium]HRZ76479.1 hemolysin family protein [Bacteroidales bacterium]